MEPDQSLGFGEDSNLSAGLSGTKRVCDGSSSSKNFGNSDVIKKVRLSENFDDDQVIKNEEDPVFKPETDLNGPIEGHTTYISSDDEDEKLGGSSDDKGILDLGLIINGGKGDVGGGSSRMGGQRRYTTKEKGKDKADDSSLWLVNNPGGEGLTSRCLKFELDEDEQIYDLRYLSEKLQLAEAAKIIQSFSSVTEMQERSEEILVNQESLVEMPANQEILPEIPANQERLQEMHANQEIERAVLRSQEYESRRRAERIEVARSFAHYHSEEDLWGGDYRGDKKVKEPSNEAEVTLEDLSGPFCSALKAIKNRNTKQRAENLVQWTANSSDFPPRLVPSLLDLSLDVLAKNADAISTIDHVPEQLKQRLTNLLCDTRKMDIHILELLLKDSPTEIHVKDCSWMTEAQFIKAFGKSDLQNLRVLQLDLCGQCSFDNIICNSIAHSPNSLPSLGILSLRGARRLSDNTVKSLLVSAPLIQSVNLGQCALLTSAGIQILADFLKTNLRELYIDDCPGIDALRVSPSMKKFEHLEVLSVAGIQTVCDEFIRGIMAACGGNLKELNLSNCRGLTNRSLEAIGNHCPQLCSLNISNLCNLTDFGICYLANGCRSLQSLKITCNEFSDEAVAAFLETSGGSLKELSLNKVRRVSFNTALSLARCSRKLTFLDLSWCRKITNEALGLIIDSCWSLRLLKLFGCTQIRDSFPYSHSNTQVRIVGLNLTPLLQHVKMFEPVGVLLRYSPLKSGVLPHNEKIVNVTRYY